MKGNSMDKTRLTVKAGAKEYFYVLIWIALTVIIGDAAVSLFKGPPVIKSVFMIAMMCVMVYFVYKKYSAVFLYELGEDGIKVSERIGRRERSVYVEYSSVKGISADGAKDSRREVFTKSIIGLRTRRYINCADGRVIIIDADDEFCALLEEKING